jgi:Beta-galactosidase/beta-glucuronidase
MRKTIDLSGEWEFRLDPEKGGQADGTASAALLDRITLPGTVSEQHKSPLRSERNEGTLTDPYLYEGWAWFSRSVDLELSSGEEVFLVLERTRASTVWVDGLVAGSENSLCSTHRHRLTGLLSSGSHRITILVDNSSCPIKGGHMTSADTQTNWNGITGRIELEIRPASYIEDAMLYPELASRSLRLSIGLHAAKGCAARLRVLSTEGAELCSSREKLEPGENKLTLALGDAVKEWSEHEPNVYGLEIVLEDGGDLYRTSFGLRELKAAGSHFEINGERTFLRGKHDALLFPRSGYAPTDLESWLALFKTAKDYGLNHYRYHTSCPPEAAFEAADRSGIYMEPELPFWGTVAAPGEEGYDEAGQAYLIREGERILAQFGNHPSFVMFSLGNELWGSPKRLDEILAHFKAIDPRPLYTQGSNNFQWVPCLVERDDFFCGVRLSKERLFRGSYAMCDAPQGHLQTCAPNADHSYDKLIRPDSISTGTLGATEVEIQYGTEAKKVSAGEGQEFIPAVPVVSHEIGQYCMAPDYSSLPKYEGSVLKAFNLEIFRDRLKAAGMLGKAEDFFRASGRFAADCYKRELEAALRSRELAGFQLLDLQDYMGQGTALVGVLDAFMESKGVISAEGWRSFCADTVLLGEFGSFVVSGGERMSLGLKIARYAPGHLDGAVVEISLYAECESGFRIERSARSGERIGRGIFDIGRVELEIPRIERPSKLVLELSLSGSTVRNRYELWAYPSAGALDSASALRETGTADAVLETRAIFETRDLSAACARLEAGETVLFFPASLDPEKSVEATYCTDFWCYPMFRSISEWMKKPIPIGTLGLLVDAGHRMFSSFPTDAWTGPEWYDVIEGSRSLILDGTSIEPQAWMIDNFERNHRLGLIFELRAGKGRAIVCCSDLPSKKGSASARALLASLRDYARHPGDEPAASLGIAEFRKLFVK